MTVNFAKIPGALRVPFFYAELDNSKANSGGQQQRALLIGQMLAAGDATANVPLQVRGGADTRARAGLGSILASMADWYRKRDSFGDLWILPIADNGGGTAAAGSIAFAGPSTAAGTLALYIAGVLVPVAIASGTAATAIATAVAAAITAATDLPVTAVVDGVVTTRVNITCRHKGLAGNDIDIRVNYRGTPAGEVVPAGVTPTIVAMAGGATNPVLTTALANLADAPFDIIVCSLTDTTSLDAIKGLLDDTNGRWSWQSQIYGHNFYAIKGTVGARTTFGTARNNQHESCLGFYDSPTPPWAWAANAAAAAAVSLRADPGLPLQTLQLDVLAAPIQSRDSLGQRNSLLYSGVSTFSVDQAGTVAIENLITTYQTNGFGQPDDSYLQVETLFTIVAILRRLKGPLTSKFGRKKLASDGTRVPPGSNAVTPNMIRAELIAQYQAMEGDLTENAAAFAANLVVERDLSNPRRVNVLYPPDLINQLGILAMLFQFRA